MSDVSIDIQNMLEDGEYPMVIARQLSIPVAWVYNVLDHMEPNEEELSPFITINS